MAAAELDGANDDARASEEETPCAEEPELAACTPLEWAEALIPADESKKLEPAAEDAAPPLEEDPEPAPPELEHANPVANPPQRTQQCVARK